jgi:putative ABC transport system substrate-binding protein
MKAIFTFFALLLCLGGLTSCKQNNSSEVTIGIIEPLEHKAMDEIVAGFSETLHAKSGQPIVIKVENAQNDANLQRAIIQKMQDANYSMIVPIGVGATQMTLSMIHDKPVISLASDLSDKDRQALHPCNVAVVHDEISSKQLLAFIHAVYPKITELTLIHSSADKVLPEVNDAIAAGKEYGITIKHLMVSSLPELSTVIQALPNHSQGIFILKDSLIVSGISTLAKAAQLHHIPLITSDQGSVQEGAGFALGVHEREIGVQGALLAADVLQGRPMCELPIANMVKLTVFINRHALQQEAQSMNAISDAAKKLGYKIEIVNQTKG